MYKRLPLALIYCINPKNPTSFPIILSAAKDLNSFKY
jgi:hypothetical protein